MENPFFYDENGYGRTLDMTKEAVQDYTLFLMRMRGISQQEALQFVLDTVSPGGKYGMVDPDCLVLTQRTEGNREKEVIKFSQYFNDIKENNLIITPVWANCYPRETRSSVLSDFAVENGKLRKKQKKQMSIAQAHGRKDEAELHDKRQTNTKLDNNSLSGTQASKFNPFYNPIAHPSLTTTCRCASGSANANNERFLAGNFHYYDCDIAIENIVSIVRNSDRKAIEQVMVKYKLHYPTPEEVWANVSKCLHRYTFDPEKELTILELITGLTPLERACYMYSNNLYSLRELNPEFVRDFLDSLCELASEPVETMEEAKAIIASMDNNTVAWITAQCTEFLNGEAIYVALEKGNELGYRLTAATTKLMLQRIQSYADLIKALWRTENQPAGVYAFPSAIREVGVLSDTDSTVFTCQEWVQWRFGNMEINPISTRLANTLIYLVTQITVHLMAMCSGNIGVAKEHMYVMEMKNEYMFLILSLTSMGKNYYGYMTMREGVPINPPKLELKGPVMRDASAPEMIVQRVERMMCGIMDKLLRNEKISIRLVLDDIISLENEIVESMKRGDPDFLTRVKVKPHVAVTKQSYDMWEEVFAQSYGHCPEPPYVGVRVPLATKNKTLLNDWIDSWEDKGLQQRFRDWIVRNDKKTISNLTIPLPVIEASGLPDIFIQGMDIRRLISTLVRSYYALMESYGIFISNKNNTLLAQDIAASYLPKRETAE
jgi:hypothetical protein